MEIGLSAEEKKLIEESMKENKELMEALARL